MKLWRMVWPASLDLHRVLAQTQLPPRLHSCSKIRFGLGPSAKVFVTACNPASVRSPPPCPSHGAAEQKKQDAAGHDARFTTGISDKSVYGEVSVNGSWDKRRHSSPCADVHFVRPDQNAEVPPRPTAFLPRGESMGPQPGWSSSLRHFTRVAYRNVG